MKKTWHVVNGQQMAIPALSAIAVKLNTKLFKQSMRRSKSVQRRDVATCLRRYIDRANKMYTHSQSHGGGYRSYHHLQMWYAYICDKYKSPEHRTAFKYDSQVSDEIIFTAETVFAAIAELPDEKNM